jgi:hypothetical protein
MRIIGLNGYARAGKDTVARYIAEIDGGRVEIVAFADLIKLSAARALKTCSDPDDVGIGAVRQWADDFKQGYSVRIFDRVGNQVGGMMGREFLQRYGTEAHRELFGDDFWVDQIDWEPDCDVLVFTDVRFENEAKAILERGGEVWRIERPSSRAGSHASERPLPSDLITRTIINNYDLDHLRGDVEFLLELPVGAR